MRLLLTLLALLTGFASADRAMAAPAVPAAMGSLVMLAESAGKVEARKAGPPHLPGLLTGSDRALE